MCMNAKPHGPVSACSNALVGFAALWFVAFYALWYTNGPSKDGWSQTPLPALITLVATPVLCVAAVVALFRARRRSTSRLTWFDWFALLAGVVTMSLGGLLVAALLHSLHGMGIL